MGYGTTHIANIQTACHERIMNSTSSTNRMTQVTPPVTGRGWHFFEPS